MLQHLPSWMGKLLKDVRAGHENLTMTKVGTGQAAVEVQLLSSAFENGERLPARFTADGDGTSPPISWGALPEGTVSVAIIVEDPDAPTPNPLVHALLWNIPIQTNKIAEGHMADGQHVIGTPGLNSYLVRGWLPPDPPTGHGTHHYVFQLFALSSLAELGSKPGRSEVIEAMTGKVLGLGVLFGKYERDA